MNNSNTANIITPSQADKWTKEKVAEHFREAALTARKLPAVKVRGYFNSWPDIKYSANELMMQEPRKLRLQATPEAIKRLEQTFDWLQWIDVRERKLIWQRAERIPWKDICWELGLSKATVWNKWNFALNKICKNLNRR